MFNPFRRRVKIPIRKMPGGWEPWNNRQPPKAMSWRPFIMAFVGIFSICGIIYGLWMTFLAPDAPIPTPTFDLMSADSFVEQVIYFDQTPRFGSSTLEATLIPTPTLTLSPSPTLTAMTSTGVNTPQVTWTIQPTYTLYPTYTPVPDYMREVERLITSPPEIIEHILEVVVTSPPQLQYVEVTVEVVRNVIEYVVVTATPSPTLEAPPVFTQPPPVYLLPPTAENLPEGVYDVSNP